MQNSVKNNNNNNFHSYHILSIDKDSDLHFNETQLNLYNQPLIKMTLSDKVNLTAITWAHAVNSQQELSEALNSE